jgi:hypothetical protein
MGKQDTFGGIRRAAGAHRFRDMAGYNEIVDGKLGNR